MHPAMPVDKPLGEAFFGVCMVNGTLDLLCEAIARNFGAVLSLPSAGMLRHCKTRFLAEHDGAFWIESVPSESVLIDKLIETGTPVGIAFKSSTNKVIFTTKALRRQADFSPNPDLKLDAMLLQFPETVKNVQRRTNYRVKIVGDTGLSVRVWRIPEHFFLRDKPSGTLELPIKVRDLSVGGICMFCAARDGSALKLAADQRLRVQFCFEDIEAVIEGRVKHAIPTPDKSLRVGVQFKKLENDLEGRQILSKLTNIVARLQRQEIRRSICAA